MHQIYQSDNRKFRLYIKVKCKGKKAFRVWAEDYGKPNSKYADRVIEVDGERSIFFSFPVSPKTLFFACVNSQNPQDKDYEVQLIEAPLVTYNIWMDAQTQDFLDLAIPFAQTCGFTTPGPGGKTYDYEGFRIKFYDIIREPMTGKPMSTPARIGHSTGKMDISKYRFDKFTIPMRVAIELHEFSHKYKNPKINLPINHESGADINSLYIYLGLGFSKVDAICVYAKVFLKAQTKQNIERMRKINDYIQRFENEEFAQKNV